MKRLIALLIAALMVPTLVAGCGSSGTTGTDQSAASTVSAPAASSAAASTAPTADTKKDVKGKLTIQSWNFAYGSFGSEPDPIKSLKKFQDYFKTFYPNIEPEFTMVQYTDHYNKLKVDFAAGEGPDVIGIQAGAPMVEFKPFLAPVNKYAERDWGADWQTKFADGAFTQINQLGKDILGIPVIMSYAGQMWYSQTLLDKYRLQAPKTWDELKGVAKTLRDNKELPLVIGAKDQWIDLDIYNVMANGISRGKIYDAVEGKTPWTDPDLLKAFDYWQKLFTEKIVQDGALGVNMYMEAYSIWKSDKGDCKAPLQINGSWEMGSLSKADPSYDKTATFKKSVALFPSLSADGKPSPMVSTPDVIFAMTSVSKNPDAAWAFMRWSASEEGQQANADGLSGFPAWKATKAKIEMTPDLKVAYENYMTWAKDSVAGYREIPYPELKQALADNLQLLAASKVTPQQAAEAVEKASKAQKR